MRLFSAAHRRVFAMLLALTAAGSAVQAQTSYFNLDGGRPDRVEDAEATSLYALDLDLGPFQFEHLVGGTNRYRAEPKLSYGILPFTELEIRVPVVFVQPPMGSGLPRSSGVATVAIGALHAFNLETPRWPALAIAGEEALPIGTLAPPRSAYMFKLLSTKTTALGRIHVNVGAGTYSVPSSPQQATEDGPPLIFDSPCSDVPDDPPVVGTGAIAMNLQPGSGTSTGTPTSPTYGTHWIAGLGVDHALAVRSTLFMADLVAERFVGLYSRDDWTAEAGIRHQVTPLLTFEMGFGWHFAGIVRSTSVTFGGIYELATKPLPAHQAAGP